MKTILSSLKGDKTIWGIIAFLALISFLPVYSASTNLVYVIGKGSTVGYLIKHAVLLFTGFLIIYAVHRVPYKYFSGGSVILLPISIFLLGFTLMQGTTIGGENASRWIRIPFVGIGFQTSTLAGVIALVYTARYLAKNKEKQITFKESFVQFWIPIGLVLMLILPANFSTTAIIFMMILMLCFLGGYPLKYIFYILGMSILSLAFFILLAKALPDIMPNRVQTWESRIENFGKETGTEQYQVEKAKIAIATGGIAGKGAGKSVQKNFLPQSTSDFIYAIIIEEFGLVGGVSLIAIYFLFLFRLFIVLKNTTTVFGMLLVVGCGLPIVFQAIINMAVATNLFPVTGQTLPMISSGGTSVWMTCLSIGMILSVSASKKETEEDILDDNPLNVMHETL